LARHADARSNKRFLEGQSSSRACTDAGVPAVLGKLTHKESVSQKRMSEPRDLAEYQSDHDVLIKLRTIMHLMKEKLDKIDRQFVTQSEFWPIKVLVYGCAGIMLSSIVGALVYLVIKQ
jgi:hypothetical protein